MYHFFWESFGNRPPRRFSPPQYVGEKSCSRKISGHVAGSKSYRTRETGRYGGIFPKVGGCVSAPKAQFVLNQNFKVYTTGSFTLFFDSFQFNLDTDMQTWYPTLIWS